MARILSSIALDTPASPLNTGVGNTFTFAGTVTLSGTAGVQRYDIKFEVNDGSGYVTIIGSGSKLLTSDTNPLVNQNGASGTQYSITVTCSVAGTYTIRIAGAPSTGGSYTIFSSTQTVTVTSPKKKYAIIT